MKSPVKYITEEEEQVLCPNCFKEKQANNACPECGFNESEIQNSLALPYRTLLGNQFIVGRILGSFGGFGITYLGWDVQLEIYVAIKEYFPRQVATRDRLTLRIVALAESQAVYNQGCKQFLKEARTLAQLAHPNIIRVRNYFEANGTAYMVMDYCQGINLAEYLDNQGGTISHHKAINLMMPILDALSSVHGKGFLHRDIKPTNIYIAADETPILLDFGSAKSLVVGVTQSLTTSLTPGFAAYEQYQMNGNQGPWTDVYGCAATLYYMITGMLPQQAFERIDQDKLIAANLISPAVSPAIANAVARGMAVRVQERTQDIELFRRSLLEDTGMNGMAATQCIIRAIPPTEIQQLGPKMKFVSTSWQPEWTKARKNFSMTKLWVTAGIVATLLAGGIWLGINLDSHKVDSDQNQPVAQDLAPATLQTSPTPVTLPTPVVPATEKPGNSSHNSSKKHR